MMDGADPDGRQKRRLPQWMLGVAVVEHMKESKNGDKNNENCLKEELASQACQPKSKTRGWNSGKIGLPHNEESLDIGPSVIEKSSRKKRRQKLSEEDGDSGSDIYEVGSKRKKDQVMRMVSRKTKKGKSIKFRSCEGADNNLSLSEDNGELTVEDLMSIAEEYVEADREMQVEQLSSMACASETQLPAAASTRNGARGSLSALENDGKSSVHETVPSCNSAESLTEDILVNHGRTGDPSQDMLDLFLGPLLKNL